MRRDEASVRKAGDGRHARALEGCNLLGVSASADSIDGHRDPKGPVFLRAPARQAHLAEMAKGPGLERRRSK